MKQLEDGMRTEEIESAMKTPKVAYAMLGASNYPDSVIQYLSKLRFEKEISNNYVGMKCPLCNDDIDRDHTIKCKYSAGFRTQRHDGVVNAILKALNKTRKAAANKIENRLKPDIDLTIENARYCIDVNFSIENAQ